MKIDELNNEIGLHAAPIIAKDTIIVGAAHIEGGAPRHYQAVIGNVRAYDVRTGKRRWIFHTVPRPDEFGNDTWLENSWATPATPACGAQMSVDEELNTVYMGVEMPTGDYYGGHRLGDGLFGETSSRWIHDRSTQVALPDGPSRHLGLGHPVRAHPGGHHR